MTGTLTTTQITMDGTTKENKMKEVRFGTIPEEYQDKEGKTKTSWSPSGHKAIIDWEEKKLFVVDARNGKNVMFFPKKEDSTKPSAPVSNDLRPDEEVPF